MVFRYDFAVPHEESNDTGDDETTQDDRTAAMSGSDSPAPARGGSNQRHFADSLESPGDEIGPYKLISQIGEGGFGTVWLAQRRHPFTQRVALKVIKAGMDSKSVLARFDQERQALAVMDHPNIAKVLDGGMTKSGRPYFAMEFVKGEPITEFCDKHKLTITERLKLFEKACEAIQHAHLKGIIHRDIKPGNIIAFATEGAAPGLKVIDFGIAKATSHLMSANTVYTETGQMIGTPDYMSPEQACSTSADVDTRTDIYSLGVLLYELLTGALPFDPKHLRSKAYREIQRIVQEDEPPSPSARLSAIATKERELASKIEKCRKIATAELLRNLRRELEWIPLMAMRKEPRNRYQTAISLADDIRNYLNGAPLVAAPESRMYRLRKTVKRHRALVTGMAAVLLTLVVGLSLATWQWRVAEERSREATNQRIEAGLARDGEHAQRAIADAKSREAIESSRKLKEEVLISTTRLGLSRLQEGDSVVAVQEAAQLEALGAADRLTTKLLRMNVDDSSEVFKIIDSNAKYLAMSWSGDFVAILDDRSFASVQVIDSRTGEVRATLEGSPGDFDRACFSPNESNLAFVGSDHSVRLWSLGNRTSSATLLDALSKTEGDELSPSCLAFSPDGKTLAVGSLDGTVHLWDTADGTKLRTIECAEMILSVVFSPDGGTIAFGSEEGTLRLWNWTEGKVVGEIALDDGKWVSVALVSIAFSADGEYLAALTHDGLVHLWYRSTLSEVFLADNKQYSARLRGEFNRMIAFSPDSLTLGAPSLDGVRVWNCLSGRHLGDVLGTGQPIAQFTFGRDAATIITCSSVSSNPDARPVPDYRAEALSLEPVASGGTIGFEVRRWDLSNIHDFYVCDGAIQETVDLAHSPDGRSSIRKIHHHALTLWDRTTNQNVVRFRGDFWDIRLAEFSRDGATIATANERGDIALWDVESGARLDCIEGGGDSIRSISFSADDRLIAWTSSPKSRPQISTVRVWDRNAHKVIVAPQSADHIAPKHYITQARFSSVGSVLAMAGVMPKALNMEKRAYLELLDCDTLRHLWLIEESFENISMIAFSPDGKLIAVSTNLPHPSIQLRAIHDGKLLSRLKPGSNQVDSIAWCADRKTIASYAALDSLFFWDHQTGRELGELRANENTAARFLFTRAAEELSRASTGDVGKLVRDFPHRSPHSTVQQELIQIDRAASGLAVEIAAAGASLDALMQLRTRVHADLALAGGARKAALIALTAAELSIVRKADLNRLLEGFRALSLRLPRDELLKEEFFYMNYRKLSPEEIGLFREANMSNPAYFDAELLNAFVCYEGRFFSGREVGHLDMATRAVERTNRKDGAYLDTLALVQWRLGQRSKAVETQQEAIRVAEEKTPSALPIAAEEEARQLAEYRATLSKYRGEPLPASLTP